jgi:hypothetical protein
LTVTCSLFFLLAGRKLIVLLVPCICRSAHRPTFALLSDIKKCSVPDLLFNIIGQFQNQFLRLPCRCIVKARGDMHERCKPEGHAWPRLHIGCTYPYVPLVFFFRDMVKRQILADRAACLIERHQNWEMNPEEFEKRWGQSPSKMSIIRGPDCLLRPRHGPEGDHESEWETVDGENSSTSGTQV